MVGATGPSSIIIIIVLEVAVVAPEDMRGMFSPSIRARVTRSRLELAVRVRMAHPLALAAC